MPEDNEQPKERKTLDDRAKMTELERIRHSCAHVLATAILRIWPEAQFAAGPPVENGFYYDVDLPHRISPEDFPKIEEEMKKEIKANHVFEKIAVSREQAMKDSESGRLGGLSERPGNPSKFKIGNLADIPEGEQITCYRNGDFIDLCAGPHVMRTGNIGAFKLTHVASAYYKGDERNPQLQRIYGTAFKNKTEMEAYFTMLEEAKKRDHRKIGTEMGLFAIDTEFVGPGLPLWLPKGTAIVEELEKLAKETEFAAGYVRVKTPHIAKEKIYLTSGHLPVLYAASMFPPMTLDEFRIERKQLQEEIIGLRAVLANYGELLAEEKIAAQKDDLYDILSAEEKLGLVETAIEAGRAPAKIAAAYQELCKASQKLRRLPDPDSYYLKAMNCPHHHRIFAAQPRSYRDRDNTEKTPLCIHRAPLGTHERFIGFLIEHYAGNFPLWLAPEQVRVLTLNDDEKLVAYAKEIYRELRAAEVRAEADFSADPVKAKIAEAEKAKVHTMLVIGHRDMEAGQVSVRLHSRGPQGAKPKGEAVAEILTTIKERRV